MDFKSLNLLFWPAEEEDERGVSGYVRRRVED